MVALYSCEQLRAAGFSNQELLSVGCSARPIYICFPKDTQVTTDEGDIAIQKLVPGKHTIKNKEIVAITKTPAKDNKLIRVKKDAFGDNLPAKDVIISEYHAIKRNGKLIQAKDFVKRNKNIEYTENKEKYLYNVLLKTPGIMKINNLEVETLHPRNEIASLYNGLKSNNEIRKMIKEIQKEQIKQLKSKKNMKLIK